MPRFQDMEIHCGFSLYDAKTGDPVDVFTIDELKTEAITGNLLISDDGKLYAEGVCGRGVIPIPKGRYVVQFGNGMIYGW